MKRSLQVSAPLLASAAVALISGCRQQPEMQRCVDEHNVVVADSFCKNSATQQPIRNSTGGFYYPYRYYYGGMGGYGLGSPVSGGSFGAVSGHSYSTTSRGGFGSSMSGGSSGESGGGGAHGGGSGGE